MELLCFPCSRRAYQSVELSRAEAIVESSTAQANARIERTFLKSSTKRALINVSTVMGERQCAQLAVRSSQVCHSACIRGVHFDS